MSYNDEEILRRLRLGEDSAWEFKQVEFSGDQPVSPRRDDWADEVGAFANASGDALLCGGSLVFGSCAVGGGMVVFQPRST